MWLEPNLVRQGVKVELRAYETYDMAVRDLEIGRIAAALCDLARQWDSSRPAAT